MKGKKTGKAAVTSRKQNQKTGSLKTKYESETGPKIPKLNLGKIKTSVKNEYFSKNISEFDDTSLGDYEMILRNQRIKDPSSILTASKSQNNQSIGSYNSRFYNRSKVKGRDHTKVSSSKHQTMISKKSHQRQSGKHQLGASHHHHFNARHSHILAHSRHVADLAGQ